MPLERNVVRFIDNFSTVCGWIVQLQRTLSTIHGCLHAMHPRANCHHPHVFLRSMRANLAGPVVGRDRGVARVRNASSRCIRPTQPSRPLVTTLQQGVQQGLEQGVQQGVRKGVHDARGAAGGESGGAARKGVAGGATRLCRSGHTAKCSGLRRTLAMTRMAERSALSRYTGRIVPARVIPLPLQGQPDALPRTHVDAGTDSDAH